MRATRSSSRLLGGGSASVHSGIHPSGCGPGDPPLARPLNFPPGVGLETPPGQTPQLPPGCGPGDPPPARSLNLPPGCGPGDLQDMLGYHRQPPPTPLDRIIDTRF